MASIRPPRRRPTAAPRPALPPAPPDAATACPTRRVVDVLADKWTPLVLCALVPGTRRFQELRRGIGVTQKMLTQTLRTLERDGLVSRRPYAMVPPRVEYDLTPLGRSLVAPLWALRDWAWAHVPEVEAARRAYDAARGGRP